MIIPYMPNHLNAFEPNIFSVPDSDYFALDGKEWLRYTMQDEGKTKAIIYFRDNGGNDWCGFFLIGKDFRRKHKTELMEFIEDMISIHSPKRLWTLSRECDVLTRWHKLLGMVKESYMEVMGEKCVVWARRF